LSGAEQRWRKKKKKKKKQTVLAMEREGREKKVDV